MKHIIGKAVIGAGAAAGYVLGARAGRERYEQIRAATKKVATNPRVKSTVKQAEDKVKDKIRPDDPSRREDPPRDDLLWSAGETVESANQRTDPDLSPFDADVQEAAAQVANESADKRDH